MATHRITQVAVESLVKENAPMARVTQAAIEALIKVSSPGARVTQVAIESLVKVSTPTVRVSQVVVEALVALDIVPDQPAHCGLFLTADGEVSVPVVFIPAGTAARADYAVSETAPDPASEEWLFLGRSETVATFATPPLPGESVVWVRLRTEKKGDEPGVWTSPESIMLPPGEPEPPPEEPSPTVLDLVGENTSYFYSEDDTITNGYWVYQGRCGFDVNSETESVRIEYNLNNGPWQHLQDLDVSPGGTGYSSSDVGCAQDDTIHFRVTPYSGDALAGTEGAASTTSVLII